jgi:putative N6-adenine-specific DNA methylase
LVIVRLVNDECTLSIDTSGPLLHRRGYRLETAKAPLRETLAAGLLLASGWDAASPLLDPFCGSGTIAIEAALLAKQIPPGSARRFAFMDWPGFQPAAWDALLAESRQAIRPDIPPILASDRDAGAVQIAQANAGRAGLAGHIEFSHRAVSAIEPAGTGWVVTNPPYGLRVSANKDLRNLYAQFGNVLRLKCPAWHIAVLCSDPALLRQIGLPLDTSLSLVNGGVAVRLGRGVVRTANC